MFRVNGVFAGILLASLVVNAFTFERTLALAELPNADTQSALTADSAIVSEVPAEVPAGVVGYYTTDGGKTFTPIKEQEGVVERIPSRVNQADFMATHQMSPQSEAAIVHQVPPVPVVVDGVLYQPEQIHLFDGTQLGFKVGNDDQLYAFTSFAALDNFVQRQHSPYVIQSDSDFNFYYENINYDHGGTWTQLLTGFTVNSLSGYYLNNMISSMQIRPLAGNGSTLFDYENLQGDYLYKDGGDYGSLGAYWNDRASSLIVWPG